MAESLIEISFLNEQAFISSIADAARKVSDLSLPMRLIADDFYKSEKAIFQLKSKGAYKQLASSTIKYKAKKGSVYPILKGVGPQRGRLERSITKRGAKENITNITKQSVEVGSSVFYAKYQQFGTKRGIPPRPFIFVGPESSFFTSKDRSDGGGRLTRWTRILEIHVSRILGAR